MGFMTIPSLRFSKLPGIHLLSVLSFLKFCFYYFGFGSVIRLLKGLRFQLAVVWVAVFTAGDVQQHHLVVSCDGHVRCAAVVVCTAAGWRWQAARLMCLSCVVVWSDLPRLFGAA